ncbi:MAG: hypothetical protein KJ804_02630 [Proteobacteria bacterium]|nr:hypothetical protein [Pseudomonadota bacterium]MBU1057201.1 hypothetical protein [Pseudomonadota bacterium]
MKLRVLLVIICFFFYGTTPVGATDLRGRVDGIGQWASAPFPLAKASVEIKRQDNSQSVVAVYRTGRDGMYYFRNVSPGQYLLVVNNSLTVPIQVETTPLQDIGPLLFRY